jgi:hypothetical protein
MAVSLRMTQNPWRHSVLLKWYSVSEHRYVLKMREDWKSVVNLGGASADRLQYAYVRRTRTRQGIGSFAG